MVLRVTGVELFEAHLHGDALRRLGLADAGALEDGARGGAHARDTRAGIHVERGLLQRGLRPRGARVLSQQGGRA